MANYEEEQGLRTEEVRVEVSRTRVKTRGKNVDASESKSLMVRPFVVTPALVTIKLGVTLNQGNYESLRADASISCPCYVEEISDMHLELYDVVRKQLDYAINKMKDEK
jgi:hypothetical protein